MRKGIKGFILVAMATVLLLSAGVLVPEKAAAATDMQGEWSYVGNNHAGRMNVTSQTGSNFSGTINVDAGKTEKLINGKISGNQVTFTRMWDSGSLRQDYSGTLTINADGSLTMAGTFTQNGASSYTWRASKAAPTTPAPTPTTVTPTTPAPASTAAKGSSGEAFASGSRLSWGSVNSLGYRLFRSTSKSSLGISVTDFYITSTTYADVNVEPNTTYYYTVKPVLAEARPFEGIEEKLGNTIATFTITTGPGVYKPGVFKHFILLQLNNPIMSIDGIKKEVDPGRGTAPITISGRTMVPIGAIVEAMGGTTGWDPGAKKVTLSARNTTIVMWLGKTNITVNGAGKKMDVVPVTRNGRTFVPLRFAAENLNCKVDWLNSTQEAVIVYEDIEDVG